MTLSSVMSDCRSKALASTFSNIRKVEPCCSSLFNSGSLVYGYQSLDGRKSDAPSLVIGIVPSFGLIELLKDVFLFFLSNTYARVGHSHVEIGVVVFLPCDD